jgi:hypothetical protein
MLLMNNLQELVISLRRKTFGKERERDQRFNTFLPQPIENREKCIPHFAAACVDATAPDSRPPDARGANSLVVLSSKRGMNTGLEGPAVWHGRCVLSAETVAVNGLVLSGWWKRTVDRSA